MRITVLLFAFMTIAAAAFAQQPDNKKNRQTATAKKEGHLKLYPLVADKYVNMYVDYAQPTDFVLTIVAGPLNNERKWELKAKESYQQKLDITQLPDGDYTIVLEGGGIREEATFTVKR